MTKIVSFFRYSLCNFRRVFFCSANRMVRKLYCINIPSAVKTGDGGLGMALEVYPGKIILRDRNYITAEWLDKYVYTFDY